MIELTARVLDEHMEEVLDWLILDAPYGVFVFSEAGETRLSIRGSAEELPSRSELEERAPETVLAIEQREVPDDSDERRLFDYREVAIGGRLVIRPAWGPPAAAGMIDVSITDTGFGTGEHFTTRTCLEYILELEPGGGFADLGCGSGVLALTAAKLGFSPVVAVDFDTDAIAATVTNAEANGVALDARVADLLDERPPVARTMAVNIDVPVHMKIAPRLETLRS